MDQLEKNGLHGPVMSGRQAYSGPCGSRRLRMALPGGLWRARTLRCDPRVTLNADVDYLRESSTSDIAQSLLVEVVGGLIQPPD